VKKQIAPFAEFFLEERIAMRREYEIKGWRREKKLDLIKSSQ